MNAEKIRLVQVHDVKKTKIITEDLKKEIVHALKEKGQNYQEVWEKKLINKIFVRLRLIAQQKGDTRNFPFDIYETVDVTGIGQFGQLQKINVCRAMRRAHLYLKSQGFKARFKKEKDKNLGRGYWNATLEVLGIEQ